MRLISDRSLRKNIFYDFCPTIGVIKGDEKHGEPEIFFSSLGVASGHQKMAKIRFLRFWLTTQHYNWKIALIVLYGQKYIIKYFKTIGHFDIDIRYDSDIAQTKFKIWQNGV